MTSLKNDSIYDPKAFQFVSEIQNLIRANYLLEAKKLAQDTFQQLENSLSSYFESNI